MAGRWRWSAALVAGIAAATTALASAAAAEPAPGTTITRVSYVHRVYVAKVTNAGAFHASNPTMLAGVDRVLQRWVYEADGKIASFSRAGHVHDFTTTSDCQGDMWGEAAAAFPNIDFGANGNHLVVLAPPGCDFGIGTIGRSLASGGKVEVRYDPHYFFQDLMHELGHNFGLQHADAQICDPTCNLVEYGDHYSFMGASIYGGYTPPTLETIVRAQLGITARCEVPNVRLATGQQKVVATYDLFARSANDGTRGLRIVDPAHGGVYWLEWRNRSGRDSHAYYGPAATSESGEQTDTYADGVTIARRAANGHTYVLSYPEGSSYPGGAPTKFAFSRGTGEGYTSKDGDLKVAVDAMGSTTAQVTITLDDPAVTAAVPPAAQHGTVVIHGAVRVGETIAAAPHHGWSKGACFRYQWFADGAPIARARAATFTVPPALQGERISVRVIVQRVGYAARIVRSARRFVKS